MSGSSRPSGFDVSVSWYRRERVEAVKLGMRELASFLSHFDETVRTKLAALDSRLTGLEASLSHLEAGLGLPSDG